MNLSPRRGNMLVKVIDQFEARFSGIERLFTKQGADRLRRAHVCVIGLGGVGSWAVEALARSGIGTLTLVDLDDVCITNVNRQLHAVTDEFGKPKVEVLQRRVAAINPGCVVHPLHAFFLKSNAEQLLQTRFEAVVDAIDGPSMKAHLIALCRERRIQVLTVGGAGGRTDPTAIEVGDLAFTSHDRLLVQVRRLLRRHHGFPRGDKPFGVECVFSREAPHAPEAEQTSCRAHGAGKSPDLRLDCHTGYGTASFLTGTFGFVAASRVVKRIAAGVSPDR